MFHDPLQRCAPDAPWHEYGPTKGVDPGDASTEDGDDY
jgi:hypothetical protein